VLAVLFVLDGLRDLLPITFGNGNKLIVELGVDFRGELLGRRGWHDAPSFLFDSHLTS
jgi:hypothetical protein